MSRDAAPFEERLAAAPISWGVCEVPGWGWQYGPGTVLAQMADLGLRATEFGPDGFLPADLLARARALAAHGLTAVGQFVPLVLHEPGVDPVALVGDTLDDLAAAGAGTLVLAAATGRDGYDERPVLDERGWSTLLANLDRLDVVAAERGLTATLHPHVGTMVESGEETDRVLAGSTMRLCLDTGHLLIGGGDPVAVAQRQPQRIAHVHLKDVDRAVARRVQAGELGYTEAVGRGLYRALGEGDVDIAAIVRALEDSGYAGWYVLEQDTILTGDPDAAGASQRAPVDDVRRSLDYLLSL